MRDRMKVAAGLGSIWGLFTFGGILIGSLSIGENDTYPERVALVVYGVSLLPSCLVAIWRPKFAAIWLLAVAAVSTFGFGYQVFTRNRAGQTFASSFGSIAWALMLVTIPILLGYTFLNEKQTRL